MSTKQEKISKALKKHGVKTVGELVTKFLPKCKKCKGDLEIVPTPSPIKPKKGEIVICLGTKCKKCGDIDKPTKVRRVT